MRWLLPKFGNPPLGRKQRLVPMSDQDKRLQEEVNLRNERRRAERAARRSEKPK